VISRKIAGTTGGCRSKKLPTDGSGAIAPDWSDLGRPRDGKAHQVAARTFAVPGLSMGFPPILCQCGNAGGPCEQAPCELFWLSVRSIAVATAAAVTASTTTPTATATAAAASSVTATPAASRLAGLGFIDCQPPPIMLALVEASDRCLSLSIGVHFDETESLRPVCITIDNNLCTLHGPELGEQCFQVGLTHVVGQVSYIKLLGQDQNSPTEVGDPQYAFRVEKKGVSIEARWVGKARREAGTGSARASVATRSSDLPSLA
jgi:hypothetical protein